MVDLFDFSNDVIIEVGIVFFRFMCGYIFVVVIGDEIVFWRMDDVVEFDYVIFDVIWFGMVIIFNFMLLCVFFFYV